MAMPETTNKNPIAETCSPDSRLTRTRLRACLAVLTVYSATVGILALAAIVVIVLGWPIEGFRINALYDVLMAHACAALLAMAVWHVTAKTTRLPVWTAKITLAVIPFVLAFSCDRLALLTYPPVGRDSSISLFDRHPTRMWTLRPNAEAPTLGVKLNEHGMRGPLIPREKTPGERRVLILGDSVAFGIGVPYEQCFDPLTVKRLQGEGFNHVTLVNLSVPGYAPWQELDLLHEKGMAYDPDLVLLAFCQNDIVAWFWRDVPIGGPRPFRFELLEHSGLLRLGRGVQHDLQQGRAAQSSHYERYSLIDALNDLDTPGVNESWNVLLDHIGQMADWAARHNRRIAFLMFPTRAQVEAKEGERRNPQRRLAAFAEAHGIPYVDLLYSFLDHEKRSGADASDLFIDDWHLSARGHEVTAAILAEFLKRYFDVVP